MVAVPNITSQSLTAARVATQPVTAVQPAISKPTLQLNPTPITVNPSTSLPTAPKPQPPEKPPERTPGPDFTVTIWRPNVTIWRPKPEPTIVLTGPITCPSPDTLILLSDDTQKRAGDLEVGDLLKTQHEDTLEWGTHEVTYVEICKAKRVKVFFDSVEFVCSDTHKFYFLDRGWDEVRNFSEGDVVKGLEKDFTILKVEEYDYGEVVVIQVDTAHTYISEGILSHNKTLAPNPTVWIPGQPGYYTPGSPGYYIPGTSTTVTTTQTGTATRIGTSNRVLTSTKSKSLGNKVVSMDVLPYMRSRNIEFICKKLKPNTTVYPFFDGQNVLGYVFPKILEIEMVSGSFIEGETVVGTFLTQENSSVNSKPSETLIYFRLCTYNHKYGPYNAPTDVYASNPYNRELSLQPYSDTSTTLNIDITSLSDLSLGTYGGNIIIGMTLIGNRSGAVATVTNKRLITDSIGTIIGSFFIPNPNVPENPKFSTGNKTFKLVDNPTNSNISGTFDTYASANFYADGLITQNQETILSIRNVENQTAILNESKPITNTTITQVPGQPIYVPGSPGSYVPGSPGGYITVWPSPVPAPTPTVTITLPPPVTVAPTQPPKKGLEPVTLINVLPGKSYSPGVGPYAASAITYIDSNGDGLFDTVNATNVAPPTNGPRPEAQVIDLNLPNNPVLQQQITNQVLDRTDNLNTFQQTLVSAIADRIYNQASNVANNPNVTVSTTQKQGSNGFGFDSTSFNIPVPTPPGSPIQKDQLTNGNNPYCKANDPLAQTFRIGSENDRTGRFVTSVDIFFYSKSNDQPVYVELRPVELGLPTQKVYPFSRVEVTPDLINVSEDGSIGTKIVFHAPVFLEGDKEHALVLLSNSTDYGVFISRLGETDISTLSLPESSRRLVTTQPILGSLFKSQNASSWTPSQYEDLKFNLYSAIFGAEGSISFFNPELNISNDQIATLRNDALAISSRIVRVGLGTTLSASTLSDLTEGTFITQRETDAIGELKYVTGIATGFLNIPNTGVGYTPSIGIQTYYSVNLFTISGAGRDATADITISDGSALSARIVSGGTGYKVGDILTPQSIGITSIGSGLRLSVSQLYSFNELVIDNVQGEFKSGIAKSMQYYSAIPGVGYTDLNGGSVFADSIITERDGLHVNIKHRNHGMHSPTNIVRISNVSSDIAPVRLESSIERDFAGEIALVGSTDEFANFENVGISSTNPGYVIINSEIISYTGLNSNTLTGVTRGVDSTLQIRHPENSFVYKYELGGVSLRRINTDHTLQDADPESNIFGLDDYTVKIDMSRNGVNRSTGIQFPKLYFNTTKSTGGSNINATQNIQYEIIHPIVQTFTPPETAIQATIRTISGTSISGDENSFVDRGTQNIRLNEDNYFPDPRLICSRVNERTFLNNIMQGRKSLQMTLNLSSNNRYLTPVIDLDRIGAILTTNRVNSLDMNYITDPSVSTLVNEPNAFVYATNPISLEVPATSIKIIVSAHLNIYNDIRAFYATMKDINEDPVYYPFPGSRNITSDGRTIENYLSDGSPDSVQLVTSNLGFESEDLTFTDYQFTVNDLESFKIFSIKLIGTSTSQTYPPRFRDLRVIALA